MHKLIIIVFLSLLVSCSGQKKLSAEEEAIVEKAKENFVFVDGGDFIMGTNYIGRSSPEHKVTLSSYSISKYETTYREFDMYCNIVGEALVCKVARIPENMDLYGANRGVNCATWHQASGYCKWLGKQIGLPLDLATEAQWEYAARSRGRDVEHATNNGKIHPSIEEPDAKRNYTIVVDKHRLDVGGYPPNPLGLYEMSGGAQEWTRDYAIGRYHRQHQFNPVQDSMYGANLKVIRGYHSLSSTVYKRMFRKPTEDFAGIRCVCNKKTPINNITK